MKSVYIYKYLLLFLIVGGVSKVEGQEVLLLEVKSQIEAIRFVPGDVLIYKVKDSKEWQERTIIRLIPSSGVILFEDGMEQVEEIGSVRLYNNVAKSIGKLLTGFGASWLLFGVVLDVAGKESFSWTTLAIGATGIGIGQLFLRVAGKRTHKLNKYNRLRLVDLSLPAKNPTIETKAP